MEHERASVPPDAMAQRSRSARATARRSTSATKKPGSSGRRASTNAADARTTRADRHPPWIRLQRVRAHRRRHPLGADGVRRTRRAGQIFDAEGHESIGAAAPLVGDRLRRVGTGRLAHQIRDARDDRDRFQDAARIYARNPFNTEFAEWIGFFDVDDAARTVTGDRTEFHRPQPHAGAIRRRCDERACRAASAPHWIRALRCR